MNKERFAVSCRACVIALLATGFNANAQNYPDKTVRILVGFAPGGGTDVFARLIAQKLSESWGQQMVVENRPGATGTIAAGIVAKSRPDGYTLMMGTVATQAILPRVFAKLPYEMTGWYGVFAPAGTPAAIVNKLHAEINRVLQAPDVRERLAALGVDQTVTRSPEEFAALVRADIVRYAKVVKAANVRID